MSPGTVLAQLRGGLIVSVQANENSVLNTPDAIALLARCCTANGALGIRAEGSARLAAVRAAVDRPVIGLIKRRYPGFEPYITATLDDVKLVIATGAEIVAFDATRRERPDNSTAASLVSEIHAAGRLAMADCSTADDALAAASGGADIVGTTLAGYTEQTRGRALPALDIVKALAHLPFVVCEGGVGSPDQVAAAFAAGAHAVVVGTALTNLDENVKRFAAASPAR